MHAIKEITPTPFGWRCCLLLFITVQKLLLFVGIGLEQEARNLMKGATQAFEQFAHAAEREPSPEGFLDPRTRLGRCFEASGGYLVFELVELRPLQSARVALILQGA